MAAAFDMMRAFEDAVARRGDSRGLNSDIPRQKCDTNFLDNSGASWNAPIMASFSRRLNKHSD